MAAKITAELRIVANGIELATLKGATLNLGNAHWKYVQGDHKIVGRAKQSAKPSVIKVPVSDTDHFSIDSVTSWEEVEVQAEADNGKTYIFKDACIADSVELGVDGESGGKWDLVLEAPGYSIAGG